MDIKDRIRRFILHHVKTLDWSDDDDIFEMGRINSMFALQLVMFLEHDFAITIDDMDLEVDNFRTISAMYKLVLRKRLINGSCNI